MPEPDEQPRQDDRWEVVVCCSLLGTGIPGLLLAAVGMRTNRNWLVIVGYVLAVPLVALLPVLAVTALVSEWRQQQK